MTEHLKQYMKIFTKRQPYVTDRETDREGEPDSSVYQQFW